ncbi:helix-turn-helix domain-containing protein [Kitasatospora sp. DSM 101779]|uniref:helix-turn-helix domain-containing protein n=1 Tax=Kitasatospora sp. DSM 101779 TaxID=2853165 RepID=UPI0021DA45E6|nr:pyridoxamine 5'-phosphate oxidase family protein [Kitasatospora sp. DSM 101779]MCU7826487.1 pyridoxamine 5'-phosphate oxidase family protein [Kitasatospora sp. DSM 101779]
MTLCRERLGLGREEVAERAGMAVEYLEYLESSAAVPDSAPLTRLAGVLGVSVGELLGAGAEVPPGRSAAAAHPVVEELTPAECWAKLASGGVGRVVLSAPDGPVALPVNFRVMDGSVVYRTAEGSSVCPEPGTPLAFEADRIDEAMSSGWSVLVKGTAIRPDGSEAVEYLRHRGRPDPWVGEGRDVLVRIRTSSVTGRSIRTDGPAAAR